MGVRLTAATVVLTVIAAGCGGGGTSSRDAVARYIEEVNAIQAELDAPFRTVANATRRLAKPQADRAAVAHDLRTAARRIDRLRVRTAAVSPPAEARRLRALVLELMRGQASLSRELAAIATFDPALQAALGPLRRDGKRLEAALNSKSTLETKATALDAYAKAVSSTLVRLRALHPPPVSVPAYETQIDTLERIRGASTALARALREKDDAALPALLRRFQDAALSNQSLAAQRAQISAVRAYNKRVRALGELTARIDRERARLQERLD